MGGGARRQGGAREGEAGACRLGGALRASAQRCCCWQLLRRLERARLAHRPTGPPHTAPAAMKRYTLTSRFWPIRKARSCASADKKHKQNTQPTHLDGMQAGCAVHTVISRWPAHAGKQPCRSPFAPLTQIGCGVPAAAQVSRATGQQQGRVGAWAGRTLNGSGLAVSSSCFKHQTPTIYTQSPVPCTQLHTHPHPHLASPTHTWGRR